LWTPDGIAPVWLARLYGHRNVQRAPGADIMMEFFVRANQRGYSSYFYGETEATLQALQARLRRQFPGHRIAGAFSPPFRKLSPEEDEAVIERINAARPDVLWVGLGMPKQEHWIYERMHRLKVPVASGVGACFSFFAGTVRRCPDWVGRIGFEWAYRFIQVPKKLWRRDLIDGPRFLLQLGLDLAGLRRQS
jgi:N-acetylglucosaminyldiphosphoundecaprenol N-acetyl-beta-D-mannosaminyltransferase